MDKITCSTLCLRDNCEAFYFKDNACMIIKDATGMTQATNTQEALTVFINEDPKEIEIGTLFQGHILVHPEQWTPYIYKSEPGTNYEKCGFSCIQADFFVLHSGTCYCGNLGHSGSAFELGQNLIQIHIKFEAADNLMDENWVRLEEGDLWHQWIYEVHQQDENTGHRECLFRGMYHEECDYVKFYYGLKRCFLGSFYFTGKPKILDDTTNMDALVYLKKDGQGQGDTLDNAPDFEKNNFKPEARTLEREFPTYGPIFRFHIKLTVNALPEGHFSNIFCLRNEEGETENDPRSPALYVSKIGRFRFVFNSLGNFDSAEVELHNPYDIIIEQSFKETKLFYEITINQEIVFSVQNTQPEIFTNAKLYISDLYFQVADVSIEYFKLYLGQVSNQDQGQGSQWDIHPDFEKTDFIPEFSTLESEFTTYGPIFRFHIKLTVNTLPEGIRRNIFIIRNEDGENENNSESEEGFGTRYPAVYLMKAGRLVVFFDSFDEGFYSAKGGIGPGIPYEIIIEQSFKETKLIFEISVNQEIVASVENTQPEMLTNAKLYLSDKYFQVADVSFEYFKLYLGHVSNQDHFIKNNYISMVGDTTKSNGIMSSQFWPTSLYKSLNIKESELTCAEMCSLVANCQFYYFVELMPSQDNVCHFGDFAYADWTKQYNEITDDTEYKLKANLDLESFGPEANPACPGSGRTKLETMLTLEYNGNTVASCFYSLYAPNAKELKIKIEQLTIHDGDSMTLVVAPAFGGHRIATLSSTSSGGEHRVQSRFLKVFWKNVDTNVEAKWKMTITPLY